MAKQTNSISGDEITMRLHTPKFFAELIDSRTASLEAAGDPEALAMWKQERQQKDQMWQDLVSASPNLKLQVVDRERLQEAVKGFAAEFARVSPEGIDQAVFEESIEDILRHEEKPPIDRQMEANREIDVWKAQQLVDRTIENKSFGVDLRASREEFLEEEKRIGRELDAEVNTPTQETTQKQDHSQNPTEESIKTPTQKIDPPEQD